MGDFADYINDSQLKPRVRGSLIPEYYCTDCGALTCVREKLPAIKEGTIKALLQAAYPVELEKDCLPR